MKQTIFIKQKVVIEYTTKEERKEVLKYLKSNPNSISVGGGSYRFYKPDAPIQLIFPKKAK